MDKNEVFKIVKNCVVEYLLSQGYNEEIGDSYQLFGSGSVLDSMGLVNIIIDIESAFLDRGYEISLTSEKAMSLKNSPFRTIKTLADYIYDQIG